MRRKHGLSLCGEPNKRWTFAYALIAENLILRNDDDSPSSSMGLEDPANEQIDIQFKEASTKQKILSSREKYNEIRPILDRIAQCTSFGTAKFRQKKLQLIEFVDSWFIDAAKEADAYDSPSADQQSVC